MTHRGATLYSPQPDDHPRAEHHLKRRRWPGAIPLALALGLLAAGCRSSGGIRGERPQNGDVRVADTRPVCRTENDVVSHLGEVCAVVGTYEVKEFFNQKGGKLRDWPVVVLAEGRRDVLIESLWDERLMPDADTIARYRGRKVEVVGRLHGAPPGRIANMAVPCVSPVESLRLMSE